MLREGWSDELHHNFVAGDIRELPDIEGLFCIKSIQGVVQNCHALNARSKLVDGSCLLWCSQLWGHQLLCSRLPCTWHYLIVINVNLRDTCFYFTQQFCHFLEKRKRKRNKNLKQKRNWYVLYMVMKRWRRKTIEMRETKPNYNLRINYEFPKSGIST